MLRETEDSVEVLECIKERTIKEFEELSTEVCDNLCEEETYIRNIRDEGREEGQDNGEESRLLHEAERDILTKIDHPFNVQLKYSFQENGIMHRDLKPENILLDEDGHDLAF
ncbi:hypothetical protein Ddye_027502 [Dipteronia dyeriana]|uniref:Protein kinase domain-containing protein n=1 Tax=Dipteronia dyeriana TaxID=168575 RepID=A0AAD9WRH0_9ROSI|nr:hypothetical protein Ddye_027502 [Dipteronia dyeriana]